MTWQLSITGLLIGALVGLTGMGGGSLMTPILILLFGFKPTLAVGTDILHGAVFKSFGAVRHRRLGTVHARITFWMFLGSAPMSLVGVEVADWLERQYGSGVESASAKVIGGALVLGGLGFLAKTFVKRGVQPSDAPFLLAEPRPRDLPCARRERRLHRRADLGRQRHVLRARDAARLPADRSEDRRDGHLPRGGAALGRRHQPPLHGNVDLGAMGWLLLGSIPGVLLASKLTVRVPDGALRVGLGAVLTASGVRLLECPATR